MNDRYYVNPKAPIHYLEEYAFYLYNTLLYP
ncbi:hypothetical protein HNO89_003297 [Sporosarcina luteola]|nr:hypothetical protein [Sporosarcina luteola]